MPNPQPIVVHYHRATLPLLGLAFLAMAGIFIVQAWKQTEMLYAIPFWIMAALFIVMSAPFIVREMCRPAQNEILIVNERGICYRHPSANVGFIAWRDIAGIDVYHHGKHWLLRLYLRDNAPYLAKLNPINRLFARFYQLQFNTPFCVFPFRHHIDVNVHELLTEIEREYGSYYHPTPPIQAA